MRTVLMACCALMLAGFAVHAATVDDVIAMAQKGEPEAKQIEAVENTPGEISVGASDVLRLRDAKVPEKVIVAMLRHVSKDAQTAAKVPSPAPAPQRPPVPNSAPMNPTVRTPIAPMIPAVRAAPPAAIRNPNQDGQLTIENLDDRTWSYMYEPAIQTIWIAFPSQGSSIQAHSATTLSMHPGHYKIRFANTQSEGMTLSINGGERSAINVSRVLVEGKEQVSVSLFENGERKASGPLVTLDNTPRETVVNQTYVETAPVYYTTPRVYYGSPYYYGGYYQPYYYGGTSLNFNFGGGGGHHRH